MQDGRSRYLLSTALTTKAMDQLHHTQSHGVGARQESLWYILFQYAICRIHGSTWNCRPPHRHLPYLHAHRRYGASATQDVRRSYPIDDVGGCTWIAGYPHFGHNSEGCICVLDVDLSTRVACVEFPTASVRVLAF